MAITTPPQLLSLTERADTVRDFFYDDGLTTDAVLGYMPTAAGVATITGNTLARLERLPHLLEFFEYVIDMIAVEEDLSPRWTWYSVGRTQISSRDLE